MTARSGVEPWMQWVNILDSGGRARLVVSVVGASWPVCSDHRGWRRPARTLRRRATGAGWWKFGGEWVPMDACGEHVEMLENRPEA